ncbi:sigma-70 family RNA polymerase sigma factor [Sphingobium sp. AS12]|nr:sigma-70 family RNA polymerase sigma factor [Sphingobium sp. AS12]MBV2150058.1 sigma-70 family RNA polymerase sigma factor [Sphingobium sp. AS12]
MSLLVSAYPDLKRRLAGRLGSADRAQEALHDTYIRLRRTEIVDEIRNPTSYLLSMALNIASNSARAEMKHLSAAEVNRLVDFPDDAPDPIQYAEARSELAAVDRALQKLPPRRRAIITRLWIENATYKELALEYSLSERTIRHEVLLATRHLHEATEVFSVEALQEQLSKVSSK